ncbi:guanine nucleotide-binding protein G(I)/G(S)/G(O) subunit gamma-12 isoform X3 [Cervus elaphus]|uniref:guanine nucleotide-binding protein G(I)/G(S)/G(O) subunit gamma-12 isoform X3 n=1 Tax=Cervus elaphus TaxID=9860 RepID=UPI001CC2E277|nr:guanine nucleotide-binding protein G(I)/G(S)/G(O) subunit gamma-12 isoform X3 [Cervus elaphus]
MLLTFLLCRPRLDPGSAARPGNSQGIWAGGRRAGREEGVLGRRRRPARRAVRPAYPERGGAGPRPEEQEEEERSESSPGALRDRVPGSGGGGGGSAPAGEFIPSPKTW